MKFAPPRPVVDAESFYQCIKQNGAFTKDDDAEAILALDDEFRALLQMMKTSNLRGEKLYAALFFQGRLRGMKTMSKLFEHHYAEEMRRQGSSTEH
jgi:hypothetical protein